MGTLHAAHSHEAASRVDEADEGKGGLHQENKAAGWRML